MFVMYKIGNNSVVTALSVYVMIHAKRYSLLGYLSIKEKNHKSLSVENWLSKLRYIIVVAIKMNKEDVYVKM